MPAGLGVLERLGVLDRIPDSESGPIRGVRYVQEDGSVLEGALPGMGGLGIRRTALSSLLLDAARGAGVDVRDRTALRAHHRTPEAMLLETDDGELAARVLVAADGLHSPLRRAEGLELPARRCRALRAPPALSSAFRGPTGWRSTSPGAPRRTSRRADPRAWAWRSSGLDRQLDATPSVESLLAKFPFLGDVSGARGRTPSRGAQARSSSARAAGWPTASCSSETPRATSTPSPGRACRSRWCAPRRSPPASRRRSGGTATSAPSVPTSRPHGGSSGSTPGPPGRCWGSPVGRRFAGLWWPGSPDARTPSSGCWPAPWAERPAPLPLTPLPRTRGESDRARAGEAGVRARMPGGRSRPPGRAASRSSPSPAASARSPGTVKATISSSRGV